MLMQKYITSILLPLFYTIQISNGLRTYTKEDMAKYRDEVKEMFYHAYNSYLKYAYPYDELRPLSCDGVDTYGSYSLTLIDALDTLAIMGNYTEFQRVVDILTTSKHNFDANINVSVFETNIRIIGGLLSAHLMSKRAGIALDPGWPCTGPLLRLAEDVARRLIPAFNTPTGMPYGTVNLRHGVPPGETTVTCTAGIGTFIVEFGALSRLTGDPLYEEVAMTALHSLYRHRSALGLFGNHIDVATGRWTASDAGIGSGVDSFFEYLVKGAALLQRPELMQMFNNARVGIEKYMRKDDWYVWVSMTKSTITLPVFQSLEAYWAGVLSHVGDLDSGMRTLHNYGAVWSQYGFTPEFYHIPSGEAGQGRETYPLRPELVESLMHLYRATGDPYLVQMGVAVLRSLQSGARTPCGFATIKDVRDHRKEDRMESFFLAETTKYLYLLFDETNFIHNSGSDGTLIETPYGECIIDTGGYIFNTEAHPLDPAALHCCHYLPSRHFDWNQIRTGKHKPNKPNNNKPETMADANVVVIATESSSGYKPDGFPSADHQRLESNGTSAATARQMAASSAVPEFIDAVLPRMRLDTSTFDAQQMLERLRLLNVADRNDTWQEEWQLLTCKVQPFLQRLQIYGEFAKVS